jgi:hypothetical protein
MPVTIVRRGRALEAGASSRSGALPRSTRARYVAIASAMNASDATAYPSRHEPVAERRAEGPRCVQRAHEPHASLQRGLHVHRGVEQSEARAEDRGGGDDHGPAVGDGEEGEAARRERSRNDEQRGRAEPLAHRAGQAARSELGERHRGEQDTKPGEGRIKCGADRWPGDPEHPGGQAKDDEAAERHRRGAHAHRPSLGSFGDRATGG